jgi:hypothetical protein
VRAVHRPFRPLRLGRQLRREVLPARSCPDARAFRQICGVAIFSALFAVVYGALFINCADYSEYDDVRIRTHAAQMLANTIASGIPLKQPPTVIDAPPSQLSEYPAVAIWLEHAELHVTQDDQVMMASINGGPLATIEAGNAETPAPMPWIVGTSTSGNGAVAQAGQWSPVQPIDVQTLTGGAKPIGVSNIGTLRCSGRIWAGARYAAKREELEDAVTLQFFQAREAPGRLLVDLQSCDVAGYVIPFGWGAATVDQTTEWVGEHTFEQRLWSWIVFELDVPILVPRTDPIVTELLLNITADIGATWSPSVNGANQTLAGGPTQDQYEIDAEGDATLENPPL